MNIINIFMQAKDICINPKGTLKKLKDDKLTMIDVIMYIAILKLIAFFAILIDYVVKWDTSIPGSLSFSIILYILSIVGILAVGFILFYLAPTFKVKPKKILCLKLSAYAATPLMLFGVFSVWPIYPFTILMFTLAAIYGVYILYLGIQIVFEPPKEQLIPFFIISLIVFIVGWLIYIRIWQQYDYWYYLNFNIIGFLI